MSRRVKLFIATSLDNYIAGIDTIVMGRKSYETALGFGTWPYPGLTSYVFTRRTDLAADPNVIFTSSPVSALIGKIRKMPGKDIWLMGGGELARSFFDEGLIDEVTVAIHPLFLGAGTPLVPIGTRKTTLRLVEEKRYDTGLLLVTYATEG